MLTELVPLRQRQHETAAALAAQRKQLGDAKCAAASNRARLDRRTSGSGSANTEACVQCREAQSQLATLAALLENVRGLHRIAMCRCFRLLVFVEHH